MNKTICIVLLMLASKVGFSQITTQGITSPTHQKFLEKIVMGNSSEAISFKNEKESLFKNEYGYGEEIYLRVYMSNSLLGHLKKDLPDLNTKDILRNGHFNVHFFLDDKEINTFKYYIKGELDDDHKETWTTFKGALYNGNNGDALFKDGYSNFLTHADKALTDGKHKVRIEIRAAIKEPVIHETAVVASGEMILNILPNSIPSDNDFFCLPKSKMTNPTLQTKVMEKYASIPANSKNVKEARIDNEEWNIVRHENTGVILYRTLDFTIIALHKDGYYVYSTCGIRQEYISGKFQDEFSYNDAHEEFRISYRCIDSK